MAATTGTSQRGNKSILSDIMDKIKMDHLKLIAVFIVFAMLGYQTVLRHIHGSDTCHWMQTQGRYQGAKGSKWHPYGCMMHKYSPIEARTCLQRSGNSTKETAHFTFIGDSRIRQLFLRFLNQIDPEAKASILQEYDGDGDDSHISNDEEESSRPLEKAHKSLFYADSDYRFRVNFYWRPVLNKSAIDLLRQLSQGVVSADTEGSNVPKILVAGTGAWEIKLSNGSDKALENYVHYLSKIERLASMWSDDNTILLWKLQEPVDVTKLSVDRQMITNNHIDEYNEAAKQALGSSRFRIWSSAHLAAEGLANSTANDGLHLDLVPLGHQVQMLLNMHCNKWMYFDDGTCCRPNEPTTIIQIISLTALHFCLVFVVAGFVFREIRRQRNKKFFLQYSTGIVLAAGEKELVDVAVQKNAEVVSPPTPAWQIALPALGKLGLIMTYFYICDRMNLFMKDSKEYSVLNFWIPTSLVFILGLFYSEDSRSTKVLHRDQTDEWKGWMQIIILIYHMTGASSVIPLYMQMRVLVSSYLFLTGYGHFCFFWNGGSPSLSRLCQVVFRMNLMTVAICLVMNRSYQSYYFVPLVTFWYMVVYAVLALPPKVSSKICEAKPVTYVYIILKLVGLLAAITALYYSEEFFKQIFLFRPWKALFVTEEENIREWWFRWSLDRYSICFGMLFGFVFLNLQKYGLIDDSTRQHLFKSKTTLILAVWASFIGLGGYTFFTLTCHNKADCNQVHSYVAFIPIVSFIILRNVFGPLRVRYSTFFAWFGRISLELFIGQYHGWLAADTHGVLVFIPDYPILNVCFTTFVLVCLAHEVHVITGQLVNVAVPGDWQTVLRNILIFFLALLPIAIHHEGWLTL